MGERAGLFLAAYLSNSRPALLVPPDDGTLFLTVTGHPFSPDVLTNLILQKHPDPDFNRAEIDRFATAAVRA